MPSNNLNDCVFLFVLSLNNEHKQKKKLQNRVFIPLSQCACLWYWYCFVFYCCQWWDLSTHERNEMISNLDNNKKRFNRQERKKGRKSCRKSIAFLPRQLFHRFICRHLEKDQRKRFICRRHSRHKTYTNSMPCT